MVRLLSANGHQVYTADTNFFQISRFSNSVKKSYVVPAPSVDREAFIQKLLSIIEEEGIDLLLPIWEEVLYISKELHRFPKSCQVFCSPFEIVNKLHNKFTFIQLQEKFGVEVPKTVLLTKASDLEELPFQDRYIAKACYCRGSRKLLKVERGEKPDIDYDPLNPWIAQEWIDGKKYCSYSICNGGQVLAHATYPVEYTMEDRSSCLVFCSYEHSPIFEWVKEFVSKSNYTGQIAFDFIEDSQGKLYAIECNPRATSGVHLFKPEDCIDRAFFKKTEETIFSKPGSKKQIAAAMVLYGWKVGYEDHKFKEYLKRTFTTRDVVFSIKDIKPFLFEPFILANYWITSLMSRSTIPKIFTEDFDWNG